MEAGDVGLKLLSEHKFEAQLRKRIFGTKFEPLISAEQAHAIFDAEVALVVVVVGVRTLSQVAFHGNSLLIFFRNYVKVLFFVYFLIFIICLFHFSSFSPIFYFHSSFTPPLMSVYLFI
jgi:hypothetical protein